MHGVHGGVDGDARLFEGDVVVEDVGERDESPGGLLGAVAVGAVDVGGLGAECGERGLETVVGEVAVDEEGDLGRGDLLLVGLIGGRVGSGGSGGLGRRRHG